MQSSRFERLYPLERNPDSGPLARSGHRIVVDDNGNLYCYGGYNPTDDQSQATSPGRDMDGFPMFKELWMFNFCSKTWYRLPTNGERPRESASYACVLVKTKFLMLGGTGYPFAEVRSNKLYCCDLPTYTWSIMNCTGCLPKRIYGHSMVHLNDYIYLFGGTTGFEYMNDMFRLHLDTLVWEILKPNDGCILSSRYRQEMGTYGENLYVFGGGTSITAEPLDKVWMFNVNTFLWTELDAGTDPTHGVPKARKCHGCVQVGDDVYICGGIGNDSSESFKDFWKFNFHSLTWSRLLFDLPKSVYFHALAASPEGCTLYVFGGVLPPSSTHHNIRESRSKGLYKINVNVKPLSLLCWETLTSLDRKLSTKPRHLLLKMGIPAHLLSLLDPMASLLPAACPS